jgi:hypothetical protein
MFNPLSPPRHKKSEPPKIGRHKRLARSRPPPRKPDYFHHYLFQFFFFKKKVFLHFKHRDKDKKKFVL